MEMDIEGILVSAALLANANVQLMDGTTAPVEKIIRDADLVIGIWPDQDEERGFDWLLIKGRQILSATVSQGIVPDVVVGEKPPGVEAVRLDAISCISVEQAEAARLSWGDGPEALN